MKRLREFPVFTKFKFSFSYTKLKSKKKCSNAKKLGLSFGRWFLVVQECCRVQSSLIKSLNLLLTRVCRKRVGYKFYVHFNTALTTKPGLRMGTGKGKVKHWVGLYRKGDIFMCFSNLADQNSFIRSKVLRTIFLKFPAKLRLVSRIC